MAADRPKAAEKGAGVSRYLDILGPSLPTLNHALKGGISGIEDRYVVFLDLLGFTNRVKGSWEDPERFFWILHTLERLRSFGRKVQGRAESEDVRLCAFSDSIVISVATAKMSLSDVFILLGLLWWWLAEHGFYARGAITQGWLVHIDNLVFGDGLVEAYEIESHRARFPRIVVSETLRGVVTPDVPFMKQDGDGEWYVDVFSARPEEDCQKLLGGLTQHVGHQPEDIKTKWEWMIQKLGRVISPKI